MKTLSHRHPAKVGDGAINVSVLCSGAHAKDIAARTLSRIHGSLRAQSAACDFRAHWCFVAELFIHEHFMAAVDATSEADLVVVSFSTCEPLPLVMLHWLEHWVPRKQGEDAALIALLHGRAAAQQFSPVENLLRSAAHSTGLALFVQYFEGERERMQSRQTVNTLDRSAESHAVECNLQPII